MARPLLAILLVGIIACCFALALPLSASAWPFHGGEGTGGGSLVEIGSGATLLNNGSTASNVPVRFGFAFARGDMPATGDTLVIEDSLGNTYNSGKFQIDQLSTRTGMIGSSDTPGWLHGVISLTEPSSWTAATPVTFHVYKTNGSYSPGAGLPVSDLTATHDFKVVISNWKDSAGNVVGSGSFTCDLNTAIATGTRGAGGGYNITYNGAVMTEVEVLQPCLDNSTGAADHGLVAEFWVGMWQASPGSGTLGKIGLMVRLSQPWQNNVASFTGAISGNTLTVSAVSSGSIEPGDPIQPSSLTASLAVIAPYGTGGTTGTGGTGTYEIIGSSQTVASESMVTMAHFAWGTVALNDGATLLRSYDSTTDFAPSDVTLDPASEPTEYTNWWCYASYVSCNSGSAPTATVASGAVTFSRSVLVSQMVNETYMWIGAGTGCTPGAYLISGYTSGTQGTLAGETDTSCTPSKWSVGAGTITNYDSTQSGEVMTFAATGGGTLPAGLDKCSSAPCFAEEVPVNNVPGPIALNRNAAAAITFANSDTVTIASAGSCVSGSCFQATRHIGIDQFSGVWLAADDNGTEFWIGGNGAQIVPCLDDACQGGTATAQRTYWESTGLVPPYVVGKVNITGTLSTSGAGSTVLLDSGNDFNSGMVGQIIGITAGTNFTASTYVITAYNSPGSVTVGYSPTPSAAGSAGTGTVGLFAAPPNPYNVSFASGANVTGGPLYRPHSTGPQETDIQGAGAHNGLGPWGNIAASWFMTQSASNWNVLNAQALSQSHAVLHDVLNNLTGYPTAYDNGPYPNEGTNYPTIGTPQPLSKNDGPTSTGNAGTVGFSLAQVPSSIANTVWDYGVFYSALNQANTPNSHEPNWGNDAIYMVSGEPWELRAVQMQAEFSELGTAPVNAVGTPFNSGGTTIGSRNIQINSFNYSGYVLAQYEGPRGPAWAFRSIVDAAVLGSDSDPVRQLMWSYYRENVDGYFAFFTAWGAIDPNANTLGIIDFPYDASIMSWFQHAYFIGSWAEANAVTHYSSPTLSGAGSLYGLNRAVRFQNLLQTTWGTTAGLNGHGVCNYWAASEEGSAFPAQIQENWAAPGVPTVDSSIAGPGWALNGNGSTWFGATITTSGVITPSDNGVANATALVQNGDEFRAYSRGDTGGANAITLFGTGYYFAVNVNNTVGSTSLQLSTTSPTVQACSASTGNTGCPAPFVPSIGSSELVSFASRPQACPAAPATNGGWDTQAASYQNEIIYGLQWALNAGSTEPNLAAGLANAQSRYNPTASSFGQIGWAWYTQHMTVP